MRKEPLTLGVFIWWTRLTGPSSRPVAELTKLLLPTDNCREAMLLFKEHRRVKVHERTHVGAPTFRRQQRVPRCASQSLLDLVAGMNWRAFFVAALSLCPALLSKPSIYPVLERSLTCALCVLTSCRPDCLLPASSPPSPLLLLPPSPYTPVAVEQTQEEEERGCWSWVVAITSLSVMCVVVVLVVVIVVLVRVRRVCRWWRTRSDTTHSSAKPARGRVGNGATVHLLSTSISSHHFEVYRPRSLTPVSPPPPHPAHTSLSLPSPSPLSLTHPSPAEPSSPVPPASPPQPSTPLSHDYSEIPTIPLSPNLFLTHSHPSLLSHNTPLRRGTRLLH